MTDRKTTFKTVINFTGNNAPVYQTKQYMLIDPVVDVSDIAAFSVYVQLIAVAIEIQITCLVGG